MEEILTEEELEEDKKVLECKALAQAIMKADEITLWVALLVLDDVTLKNMQILIDVILNDRKDIKWK